ncbi:unnamed protein product [Allacma fusca]|uniref:Uncharacterized protein n=1 Tax=Allacma fusca TaxID=39272 RepID=A0A8J2NSD5_9HEXA|nr:unnamed protein product [Allacma fusca]
MATVISNLYKCVMFSSFAIEKIPKIPTTLKELMQENYTFATVTSYNFENWRGKSEVVSTFKHFAETRLFNRSTLTQVQIYYLEFIAEKAVLVKASIAKVIRSHDFDGPKLETDDFTHQPIRKLGDRYVFIGSYYEVQKLGQMLKTVDSGAYVTKIKELPIFLERIPWFSHSNFFSKLFAQTMYGYVESGVFDWWTRIESICKSFADFEKLRREYPDREGLNTTNFLGVILTDWKASRVETVMAEFGYVTFQMLTTTIWFMSYCITATAAIFLLEVTWGLKGYCLKRLKRLWFSTW